MADCVGCGNIADVCAKENDRVTLCRSCSQLLKEIAVQPLSQRAKFRCEICDTPRGEDELVCIWCRQKALTYLHRLDEELLHDNPFVYLLAQPLMNSLRECKMTLKHPTIGEDFWGFYPRGAGFFVASFKGLLAKLENSP